MTTVNKIAPCGTDYYTNAYNTYAAQLEQNFAQKLKQNHIELTPEEFAKYQNLSKDTLKWVQEIYAKEKPCTQVNFALERLETIYDGQVSYYVAREQEIARFRCPA